MKNKITECELKKIVNESLSIAEVCRKFNIRPTGGNYKTIKLKIIKWNIDISHFTGKGWNVGKRYKQIKRSIPLNEILIKNSTYCNTSKLKERIINEKIKEYKCEICGINMWNNKKISLELHHENGDNLDNRIENLKLLCPNCHSQTEKYRNKTKKSSSSELRLSNYIQYNSYNNNVEIINEKNKSNCILCGNINKKYTNKFCSTKCLNQYKIIIANMPNKEELLIKLKELKSYLQVGIFYGKSDKTIKKWCDKYGICKNDI